MSVLGAPAHCQQSVFSVLKIVSFKVPGMFFCHCILNLTHIQFVKKLYRKKVHSSSFLLAPLFREHGARTPNFGSQPFVMWLCSQVFVVLCERKSLWSPSKYVKGPKKASDLGRSWNLSVFVVGWKECESFSFLDIYRVLGCEINFWKWMVDGKLSKTSLQMDFWVFSLPESATVSLNMDLLESPIWNR